MELQWGLYIMWYIIGLVVGIWIANKNMSWRWVRDREEFYDEVMEIALRSGMWIMSQPGPERAASHTKKMIEGYAEKYKPKEVE